MFKGDSMYSILPIDATYFFNITKGTIIGVGQHFSYGTDM